MLAVLLPTIRLEPSTSNQIVWHLGPTLAPYVKDNDPDGEDRGPELPTRVSLISDP